jgi:hypothetical protein
MLKTERLAMAMRLQFFVQPPDVHCVEQAAVAHGVVQPVVVHCTVHDLPPWLWELLQNPSLHAFPNSVLLHWFVFGVLQEEYA